MAMNRLGARMAMLVATWLATAGVAMAYTGERYNIPMGVTEISREVHGLHMLIFWVCVAIAVVVFGAMFYSVFAHRRSVHPKPADFHESTTVEIIWTAIPFVILISMAIPAAGTLIKMEDTRNAELTVKVTGYQWKWQYEYVGHDVKFFSTLAEASNRARQLGSGVDPDTVDNYLVDVDKPLVLPEDTKIRFLITANDVIHAWWVPAFAVKKDAIPGYVNEIWTKVDEPGTYRGVCAELCGRDHGFMPIVVKVVTKDEYAKWLADAKAGNTEVAAAAPVTATDAAPAMAAPAAEAAPAPEAAPAATTEVAAAPAAPAAAGGGPSKDELVKTGEKVYNANCAACHQPTGKGIPPNFPSLVDSAVVKGPVDAQVTQVLKGKNMMPPFAQLSDADIAAVVTYTRNSWGNSSGVVQADEVKALRGK
ncbi:MAG: coxB [Panacagrimonas sp.]|jgi:cytochrome c oxidase subunit 2|nr:cytochrome c oxidase subunit II [Panacagrimonas sp.]MCC2656638.1 coxB [Panacagrimonas sp.]